MSQPSEKLLLLGTGNVALAVAKQCQGTKKIIATTRNPEKIFALANLGIEPVVLPAELNQANKLVIAPIAKEIIEPLANGAQVLVSFPPDGSSDQVIAKACQSAKTIVYISSTGVYGDIKGEVNENTAIPNREDPRIKAEEIWLMLRANVLRAPGIYGPNTGLHIRLKSGEYKIPGDGNNFTSRIHIDDLANIILKIFDASLKNKIYVVGDLLPTTQKEVVGWLCEKLDIPMPSSIPFEQAPKRLQGNRKVNAQRILDDLKIDLKYPTYKEGFWQAIQYDDGK